MSKPETRRAAQTVAVLAVTQLVGWGTSFDMLGVLGRVIAPELGLANEVVFLGLSIMMLISALAGPKTGRLLDRYGASKVLAAGSVVFAAGLLLLAASHGLVLYIAAWCVIGLGGALGLSAPAYTAVVEREGLRSGRVIAILMLFTGLSSATFWPLLDWLQSLIGWRSTFVLTASVHLLVCLPLHLFALPRPVVSTERTETTERAPLVLTPRGRIYAFSLIAASTMLATLVTYGLSPSLLHIFALSGAAPALALQLGSLRGVMGISARFVDMLLGPRGSPLISATLGIGLILTSFMLLLVANGSGSMLLAFVVLYGFGSGVVTVARALLPLAVFSPRDFGLQSARLSLPQNLASAAAPVIFTSILDRAGLSTLLVTASLLAALSLFFVILLAIFIRGRKA